MWIQCPCGEQIKDTTDNISYKARYISDQDWLDVLDKIDYCIESTEQDRDKLCNEFRRFLTEKTRNIYQCTKCGKLFVEDSKGNFKEFIPSENDFNDILNRK